jgi:hypothetical protein
MSSRFILIPKTHFYISFIQFTETWTAHINTAKLGFNLRNFPDTDCSCGGLWAYFIISGGVFSKTSAAKGYAPISTVRLHAKRQDWIFHLNDRVCINGHTIWK